MNQPVPKPINPEEVPGLALAVIAADKFPVLATIEGDRPRARPVSPVRSDGFTIWVASLRSYDKTAQIEANPNVELCYLDGDHDQVRIEGVARVEERGEVIRSIWDENALLRQYLGSPENPEFVLYRIEPSRVRFMREWALNYHEVPLG